VERNSTSFLAIRLAKLAEFTEAACIVSILKSYYIFVEREMEILVCMTDLTDREQSHKKEVKSGKKNVVCKSLPQLSHVV